MDHIRHSLRLRAASALMALIGLALLAFTAVTTWRLVADPDPMLGLELTVSAALVAVSVGILWTSMRLLHGKAWSRSASIVVAVALVLYALASPLLMPRAMSSDPTGLDPMAFVVGLSGVALLALVIKPYRSG